MSRHSDSATLVSLPAARHLATLGATSIEPSSSPIYRQTRSYALAAMVYEPGDVADRLCRVRSGRVRLYRGNSVQSHTLSGVLTSGEVFGSALGTGLPMGEWALAEAGTEIEEIRSTLLDTVCRRDPDLTLGLIAALDERLHAARAESDALRVRPVRDPSSTPFSLWPIASGSPVLTGVGSTSSA